MRNSFLFLLLLISFLMGMLFRGMTDHYVKENRQLRIINECKERIDELRKSKELDEDFKNFPKYYINLDRSKERKENFEKHMKEYKITNHKRVKAFDGKNIKNKQEGLLDGWRYYNRDKNCTSAELAITMSHLMAMKHAKEDDCEIAMIMEDDCELTLVPHWKKSISEIVSEIPEDCEIFLMCNRRFLTVSEMRIEKVTNPMEFTGVCYLITKKGMKKIERFFKPAGTDDYNEGINLDLKNIVFDQGFMSEFTVYTYNVSLFLLENYTNMSTHVQQGKNIPDINQESVEILKNKPFLIEK